MKKYLTPRYGELAPEVMPKPQIPSLATITPEVRVRMESEQFADQLCAYRNTSVYGAIMRLRVTKTAFRAKDGHAVALNIYNPGREGVRPALCFIHGGGFVFASPTSYDCVTRYMAYASGAVVFSVDYRLAPEHKYPAAQEDCYAALQWIAENCAQYGADPGNLTVAGDSAGGNLAAAVCLMARDRKGPAIRRQVLIYPVLQHGQPRTDSELRYGSGYHLTLEANDSLAQCVFSSPQDALEPYASPLLAPDLSGLPQALFVSAECDLLLDQGLMYAARLAELKIKVDYRIFEGVLHGFIGETYGKSFEALDFICASVRGDG